MNIDEIISVEKHYNMKNEFADYKTTLSNGKIWFIPLDEANTDYHIIQQWIADGGTVIDNGGGE
tara:strand:+ start:142 stop:333 length:192 start_codon:yes stop_codon:yes gene_type:complete